MNLREASCHFVPFVLYEVCFDVSAPFKQTCDEVLAYGKFRSIIGGKVSVPDLLRRNFADTCSGIPLEG